MSGKYERFSTAISSVYHDIRHIERAETAKHGMKGPYAQCLLAISRYPEGIPAARLAELCDKDKAAISRTLAELSQAGLVDRGAGSRYRACLTLTEKGREAAETVRDRAQLAVDLAGDGLTEEQLELFYQVLDHIAARLHALCRDGLEPSQNQEEMK